jgi:dUTP pyrophosphatase
MQVRVRKLKGGARVPEYMSSGASGCDVTACLEEPMVVPPGGRAAVPTGLAFELSPGYEIQVRPRSGFAFKKGLTVVNAPGTIDSDFRGEVMVLVVNLGQEPVSIAPGDRIAQLVLQRVERIDWAEVDALADSARGEGGFGSTGFSHPPGATTPS